MNKRERVIAALSGQPVDRVPVSFWGHDFLREWTPQGLADAMLESFRHYDWDYMKVNPRATYYGEAWGCRYRPSGSETRGPEVVDYVLKSASDLGAIRPVDIGAGPFAEQLEALRLIGRGLGGEAPFIQTVFSPLAVIGHLAKRDLEAVRRYMEETPQALHSALAAVAGSLAAYSRACMEAGASGIFFATVEWATYDNATAEQYQEFGRPYDLRVLEAVQGAEMNVLHVCRPRNMFDLLSDYPVHAINWARRRARQPLSQGGPSPQRMRRHGRRERRDRGEGHAGRGGGGGATGPLGHGGTALPAGAGLLHSPPDARSQPAGGQRRTVGCGVGFRQTRGPRKNEAKP